MSKYEYFYGDDFNEHVLKNEFRTYQAEVYQNPNEISDTTPEMRQSAAEYPPTLQDNAPPKKAPSQKSNSDRRGKLKQIFESISKSTSKIVATVASTVAAAASVVVIATTMFAPQPTVTAHYVDAGTNYVSYSLTLENTAENTDYDIVVSNALDTFTDEEVTAGLNENTILGLREDYAYTLSLIGKDTETGGRVTFYSTTFYTTSGDTFPESYGATYKRLTAAEITAIAQDDGTYLIHLPIDFSAPESVPFGYRVSLIDERGSVVASAMGQKKSATLTVPDTCTVLYLQYEDLYLGKHFTHVYDTADLPVPLVLQKTAVTFLDGATPVGANALGVPFRVDLPADKDPRDVTLSFSFTYEENGMVVTDVIDYESFPPNERVMLTIHVGEGISEIDVSATMTDREGAEPRVHTASATYPLTTSFKASASYDAYQEIVKIDVAYLAPQGAFVRVTNLKTGEITDQSYGDTIRIQHTEGSITYRCELLDENGTPLVDAKSFTVDPSVIEGKTYDSVSYHNPSDISNTYNENGTINLYFITDFTTSHPDVYYAVILKNPYSPATTYVTTSRFLEIANIPNTTYTVEYCVFYDHEDVRYLLYYVVPSGSFEPPPLESIISYDQSETELTISIPSEIRFTPDMQLYVNGETITVSEDMISDMGERGKYITLPFTDPPDDLVLYINAYRHTYVIDQLLAIEGVSINGSWYAPYEITLY